MRERDLQAVADMAAAVVDMVEVVEAVVVAMVEEATEVVVVVTVASVEARNPTEKITYYLKLQ
jgi:hypothetical protein